MRARLAQRRSQVGAHAVTTRSPCARAGGCGSFFAITVVSQAFAGKPLVAQHRMVQDLLKDEIKTLHGVTLRTHTPEQFAARVKADANAAD